MTQISLQIAKNNLTSYDLVCIWDISVSDKTARIVRDNLQPMLVGKYADYNILVNWLAENFIFSEDRGTFRANLDLDVLKDLENDYYFSLRTQFPDGRIRDFIYFLCPSRIEDDEHVLFSIFDLENDETDIKGEDANFVAPPESAFKTPSLTGSSFKYVSLFGCLGLCIAFLGVFNIISPILAVLLLTVCAFIMFICAKSVANIYANAEKQLYKRHDAAVTSTAESLSKVVNTERELNRSRMVFLSCISRDVRTSLNTIVGLTALATKRSDDHDYVVECLSKISRENNELVSLIDNIVEISEAESGKMKLNKSTFSLAEIVSDLTNYVAEDMIGKGQSLDVRTQGVRYEYLFGDEGKIKSIFINLLTNAVKYTPLGGHIAITLRESPVPKNQDAIKLDFIIEDNGIGISDDYQKEMYSAFSRAVDNNIKKIKGTGLGLALCKRYLDIMNGTIICDSKEGIGTKFTVSLVLPIGGSDNSDMMLNPVHILLVNDDRTTLDAITENVTEMGGTVDGVATYREALCILGKKSNYDLVICEWHNHDLEVCEGVNLLRKLVGNTTPIIATSPFSWNFLKQEADCVEIDGFVQNPCFKSAIYIDAIRHTLQHSEKESKQKPIKKEFDLHGMKVLIAEDNDLNWEILAEILETVGASSVRAENGLDCVEKICNSQDGEYDVVFMDVQMPVMDGIAATMEIRKSQREYVRLIPIVAMTVDSFAETVVACNEAGMNGFMTKPVDLNKLFVEMQKIKKI